MSNPPLTSRIERLHCGMLGILLFAVAALTATASVADDVWRRARVEGGATAPGVVVVGPDDGAALYTRAAGLFGSRDAGRTWRQLPGPAGFRVVSFRPTIHPNDAGTIVQPGQRITDSSSGLLLSRDGGETWSFAKSGLNRLHGFGHDGALYATVDNRLHRSDDLGTTWEVLPFAELPPAVQLFRVRDGTVLVARVRDTEDDFEVSTDGGRTVRRLGFPPGFQVTAVDPFDVRTWVLLGVNGSEIAITRDGGTSFQVQDLDQRLSEAFFHPRRRSTLFVVGFAPGSGDPTLWSSTNSGRTFEPRSLPDAVHESRGLAFDPCDDSALYVFTPGAHGISRSADSGRSWVDISPLPEHVALYQLQPIQEGCELAAQTAWGSYVLEDRGETWTPAGLGLPTGLRGVAFDPSVSGRVLAHGSGLMLSDDHGRSWRRLRSAPAVFTEAVLVGDGSRILARDPLGRLWRSDDLGQSFVELTEVQVAGVRPDPFDPNRLLVAPLFGDGPWRISVDAGSTFDELELDASVAVGELVHDPFRTGHLLGWSDGGDELLTSRDYGRTFEIGARLPVDIQNDGLLRIGPAGTIYAVSTLGFSQFTRSFDGGTTFETVPTSIEFFRQLVVDRRDGTLYAAGRDPEQPGASIFRSRDQGTSWEPWTTGLRGGHQIAQSSHDPELFLALAADPHRRHAGEPSPCDGAESEALCLRQERFELEVTWRDDEGREQLGRMVREQASDSGMFYFFEADNWEMLVKVLDGCGLNQRHWVLAAATTDVAYSLTIRDQATGRVRRYFNNQGTLSLAIVDTNAFDGCAIAVPSPAPAAPRASTPTRVSDDLGSSCAPDLCVQGGRFRIRVDWRTAGGETGTGTAVDVRSDDSGLFYFFDADNWEVLIKVLDGCEINERFWVLAAATTDVGYTVTVTDTRTGAEATYSNPLGTVSPAIADVDAFATCSANRADVEAAGRFGPAAVASAHGDEP